MPRSAIALVLAAILGACSTAPVASQAPSAVIADLAPNGKLRAAINFGNPILATKDAASGEARGVSVDLARELARRLGVPVELVLFNAAGKVVEGLKAGTWDVAFVAIDPARAVDMDYTAPYVVIEGAYLVPEGSPIRSNSDVDRDGVRVVVGAGSAYDLYLSRELRKAQIVRAPTSPAVVDALVAQKLDVAAGVKQQLEADAKRVPGVRLLDGHFMIINQAMATPKGRAAGAHYLAEFVEEMKASGFVASALQRHGIEGAAIAPLAATQSDGRHDFDFEIGTWRTHLSRLLHPLTGSTTWIEYEGTSVVRKIWNGRANLVELEVDGPAGHIEGLSLRLYDPETRQWSLNFANSAGGSLSQPAIGEFKNGRGEFFDHEPFNGRTILVRNVFSDITPDSCRFEQAFSDDGGKTWEVNWIAMDTRVKGESDQAQQPTPARPQQSM